MLTYLKYGLTLSALSLSLVAHAAENLIDCDPNLMACGLQFTTIDPTPTLSASSNNPYASGVYTITNMGSVNVPLTSVALVRQGGDTTGFLSYVITDPTTTTCTASLVLAPNDTCNIYLDYYMANTGNFDWNLVVTPNSTQRPLSLNIQTTVTGGGAFGNLSIAAGTYDAYTTVDEYYPMVAVSGNAGADWVYQVDNNLSVPNGYDASNINNLYYGGFNQSGCYTEVGLDVCLASGVYVATDSKNYPMLAQNSGTGWDYVVEGYGAMPGDFVNSQQMLKPACYGTQCVALGTYYNSTGTIPFLYGSTNSAQTWTSHTPPAGTYYSSPPVCTSLNTSTCFAVFSDGTVKSTTNGGSSWATVYTRTNTGDIELMTCADAMHCFGASSISSTIDLVYTTDGGANWSEAQVASGTGGPSEGGGNMSVQSISCSSAGDCIMAGWVAPTTSTYVWASTASATDFTTWTLKVDQNTVQPPNMDNTVVYYQDPLSAACSTATCLVAGNYYDSSFNEYPFILDVNTPAYVVDSSSTFLSGIGYAALNSLSCLGNWCTASGEMWGGTVDVPLVLSATDGGVSTSSFTAQLDENSTSLPSDYVSGGFLSNQNSPPALLKRKK